MAAHPSVWSRWSFLLHIQLSLATPSIWCSIQFCGLGRVSYSLHFPYMVGGSPFPGSAPPNDTFNSKSVVVAKRGDSCVVLRFHVDEFTHTCLAEHFSAQPHVHPGFSFPIEPDFKDYSLFGPGSGGL